MADVSLTLGSNNYPLTVVNGTELQLSLSGPTGPTGAAGPNTVSTSTSTNLTGYIYGNGTTVGGATAATSAATANTLVLRNGSGGSNFAAVGATTVTASGVISTTGTDATITTSGVGAYVSTFGADAFISTSGTNASISTSGSNADIFTVGDDATISTEGANASIITTGTDAYIATTGINSAIFTQGANATIGTTGADAFITTSGTNAAIRTFGNFGNITTSGANAYITTSGINAPITTSGADAFIRTQGANAYIQSRSTFKLFDGTSTTTLSHSPTANRAIAFPDAAGTVALIDPSTGTQTFSGAQSFSSTTRPTSAGTGTPAATSLITLADSENAKRGWLSFECTNFTGATNVKSGGTTESATLGYSAGQSSATNGNYNGYRYGTYMAMNPAGTQTVANFDRRTIFRALILAPNTASATGEARYLWPVSTSYTTGRLTTKGIGFVVIGNKVHGHTHDGTTSRITTQFVDFGLNTTLVDCVADSNGLGTVSFYINGTLLESLAGPTGTQINARGVQANVQCVDSVTVFFQLISFSLEVKI